VHNFMQDAGSVRGAIEAYVQAVKQGRFPDDALHAW
jgi:3-methyl-2-oxobutanoate hydroxymethyltransferase